MCWKLSYWYRKQESKEAEVSQCLVRMVPFQKKWEKSLRKCMFIGKSSEEELNVSTCNTLKIMVMLSAAPLRST